MRQADNEKPSEYYYQDGNHQQMHNLQNIKYVDPCFQDLPKAHSYDMQNFNDENRNELRKHGCGADGGKFAPVQTPTASIVPQLWNPRHMLGFEEFKNLNQSLDFNDLAINLNDEMSDDNEMTPSAQSPNVAKQPPTVKGSPPPTNMSMGHEPPTQQYDNVPMHSPQFDKRATNPPHQFTAEELVPQNMVRKAKKVSVISAFSYILIFSPG